MRGTAWLVALGTLFATAAAADDDDDRPFDVVELGSPGRTAAAGFADLDGDGRRDLFSVSLTGVPPRDRRELRVYFQSPSGRLPGAADWSGEVLDAAAAYDIADFPDGPGEELLLLERDGVAVLSFPGRKPARREIRVPNGPTAGFAPDERGLDELALVRTEFPDGPLLFVPGLGTLTIMRPDGSVLGELDVGHRANYFIPPRPGPVVSENELEKFYDFPRLDVGEVNGDGRLDVISSNRHEIRTFLRAEDGSFPTQPSLELAIGRLTEKDQIRSGSGNVRVASGDFDSDGRTDLLLNQTSGGFLAARSDTTLHLNREGSWNLEAPDQEFSAEGRWSSWIIVDLEGDGRLELVEGQIPLSVLEMVEVLVTRSADVEVSVRRQVENGVFEEKPWLKRKLGVGFSFDTFEPKGFVPTLEPDLNGDGAHDQITSGDGEAIEIALGGGDDPYSRRVARQELDTTGYLRFGDLDSDGLPDFVLYDRSRPDSPLRVGRNRGVLPGTPPRIRAAPE
ncbi:MAG: VCBS repeat-containing protein [Myxococcota bacterium]|nr:VCBS repeat-containing protein [Myxococcota bacterium]